MNDDKYHALEPVVNASDKGGITVTFDAATIGPGRWPMYIPVGADWVQHVSWFTAPGQPESLGSGYTAAFVVSDRPGGATLLTLTSGAGITLSDTVPTILLTRTAAQTAAFTWAPRSWFTLTVTRTSDGKVNPVLSGPLELRR